MPVPRQLSKVARFVVGFALGAGAIYKLAASSLSTQNVMQYLSLIAVVGIGCGVIAVFYGDRFFSGMAKVLYWLSR